MSNDLTTTNPPRSLAIYDKPLPPEVVNALAFGRRLKDRGFRRMHYGDPDRGNGSPSYCKIVDTARTEMIADFAQADAAVRLLWPMAFVSGGLSRKATLAMLSALYMGLGAKTDDDTTDKLKAALDMIESDELGAATGLWEPMRLTPAVLALACRKLISSSVFKPQPAELRKACREAKCVIKWAYERASDFFDQMLECDAILLLNDPETWERIYTMPQYAPLRARVLELHESNDAYDTGERDEGEDDPPSPFAQAVMREKAKLALPAPAPAPKPTLPLARPRRKHAGPTSKSAAPTPATQKQTAREEQT